MRSTGGRRTTRRPKNTLRARRNRRRFNFKKLIWPFIVLVISGACGFGIYQVLTTPKLRVAHVEVRGTRLSNANLIGSDASSAVGHSILTLRKEPIRKRVLTHPEVESVTVGRRLPRTVVLKVTERKRFCTITNGAGFWLADNTGLPFHRISQPESDALVVQVEPEVRVVPGKRVSSVGLSRALECVKASPSMAARITKISVDRAGNLCLNIGSDFYVKLGQPVEIPQKMRELAKILQARPDIGQKVEYINMSCYQAPALKFKAGEGQTP